MCLLVLHLVIEISKNRVLCLHNIGDLSEYCEAQQQRGPKTFTARPRRTEHTLSPLSVLASSNPAASMKVEKMPNSYQQ